MSFVELGGVMFRGTLRAANGNAKFKLTAQAINAVDTVNFGGGQLSYNITATANAVTTSVGSTILSLNFNVLDDGVWIEVAAYGHLAGSVKINGTTRNNRNNTDPDKLARPFVELIQLPKGTHTVLLIAKTAGTSSSAYINCKYIRPTGA